MPSDAGRWHFPGTEAPRRQYVGGCHPQDGGQYNGQHTNNGPPLQNSNGQEPRKDLPCGESRLPNAPHLHIQCQCKKDSPQIVDCRNTAWNWLYGRMVLGGKKKNPFLSTESKIIVRSRLASLDKSECLFERTLCESHSSPTNQSKQDLAERLHKGTSTQVES